MIRITHYAKHGDVQTAGTMACLFTTVDTSTFHHGTFGTRPNIAESHNKSAASNQNKHLKPPVRYITSFYLLFLKDFHVVVVKINYLLFRKFFVI